jgi:DNA-binding NarL/FixJ family response regulator
MIEKHVESILAKLGVENREAAALVAINGGL